MSSYKTTLKQQLNGKKRFRNELKRKRERQSEQSRRKRFNTQRRKGRVKRVKEEKTE